MAKTLISSLTEGQDIADHFMVKSRYLRPFRTKVGSFLVLKLGDKSGEIQAKLWDDGESWYRQLKEEDIIKVIGHTQSYEGSLEIVIDQLWLAKNGEYALDDFLPTTTKSIAKMLAELQNIIASINNPFLQGLLQRIFDEEDLETFARAPAAKAVHHAYLGGLLEHTLEVVEYCRAALTIYPHIDRDLLLTAAILHDIGKIEEYVFERSIDFSDKGRLLGHIVLGEQLVMDRARQDAAFPEDLLMKLCHMLLSHHGRYEWKSPKRPKTIEACILYLADYFSSEVAIFAASLTNNQDSATTWTDYNRFLDRSVFTGNTAFHPPSDDERY
ncbi:MAG: HD domain-containing protein [Chloroflexi bacterium]|nr:HD domain-containing protein [Chloroflexota bacterium]MCL5076360.1 HD domain-containing protein [Chloroflexota bacterium]